MAVALHRRSHRLRTGRQSLPGQVYLITTTTRDRAPVFREPTLACAASRVVSDPSLWRDSRLLAWVLMPDHWHGLLELGGAESLSRMVGRAKAISARAVNVVRGTEGAFWSGGFHDHALRREESIREVARYIIGNPVRAGIVSCVRDYPFWDAIWVGSDFDLF